MNFASHESLNSTGRLPSTKSSARRTDEVSTHAGVRAVLNSHGESLDRETRSFFEPRFGFDFSRVRVHADSAAASSARAMDAQAYTVGHHIAFDAGKYDPRSEHGRRLIGHELAHTVQQSGAGPINALRIGSPTDASEKEADHASTSALSNGQVAIHFHSPLTVQRQVNQPSPPKLDLTENASPFMAGAIGSMTIDQFETGKSDIPAMHKDELSRTAQHIVTLLGKYPASSVHVIGHTDAVGKDFDNQTLGQSRADSVQQVLIAMGIPVEAIQTETRGASELRVKTSKGDGRNRRVEVRFQPSRAFPSVMSSRLSLDSPAAGTGSLVPPSNDCMLSPDKCKGGRPPFRPPSDTPDLTKSLPTDIPYDLMDMKAYSDAFRSHGNRPDMGGDPRETWAALYRKYRYGWGLSKERAAQMANSELSSMAGQDQKRDYPNTQDRFNQEWKNMNPNEKSIGPINIPFKPFKWEF